MRRACGELGRQDATTRVLVHNLYRIDDRRLPVFAAADRQPAAEAVALLPH